MSEIEKKEEMSKEELVYVMTLMLNCLDFKDQINKLNKPCLFRLYDDMQKRGNAFANLEDDKRSLEQEVVKLRNELQTLTHRNQVLTKQQKRDYHRNKPKGRQTKGM